MSNKRYKLHWVTAVIEVMKTAKEMVLPIIVLLFANRLKDTSTGPWYMDYLSFIIFGVLIIVFAITGIIKWKRFEYWFEEEELRIEYGLFVKKKRYIPFDRIQSLDYTEGILHRPFKLIKVKVETAGSSSAKKSEAELTAITKAAAERIEYEIAEAKKRKNSVPTEDFELEEKIVEQLPLKSVFTMSVNDLLILATTSGGIGIILSGAGIFLSQFADMIPFGWIYEEISGFIKFGILIIALVAFVGLLVVWGISVGMTFLSYFGFTVSLDERDIVITRGLLEKKRMTVPLNRVQSVRIIENPIRQLFGYAAVVIDSAGGGGAEGAKINLFPLVKKSEIYGPLKELFPGLILDEPTEKVPKRGRRFYYRINIVWIAPIIGAFIYFLFPYGLMSLLLFPIIILLGLWQHRSAGYAVSGNQLTMRFRGISLQTAFIMKKRIQSIERKQNYFHQRKRVATLIANVKSGIGIFKAHVFYLEEEAADNILSWYESSQKRKEGQQE